MKWLFVVAASLVRGRLVAGVSVGAGARLSAAGAASDLAAGAAWFVGSKLAIGFRREF